MKKKETNERKRWRNYGSQWIMGIRIQDGDVVVEQLISQQKSFIMIHSYIKTKHDHFLSSFSDKFQLENNVVYVSF